MAAIDCEKTREIWFAEADGQRPSRAERDLLESHLAECATCRAEAVLVHGMRIDDQDGPAPELDDLAQRRWITGALERAEEAEDERPPTSAVHSEGTRRVRPAFYVMAGLAVAAAVALALAVGLFGGLDEQTSPRDDAPVLAEAALEPLDGRLVLASGEVIVSGGEQRADEAVGVGTRIDAGKGTAVIDFDRTVALVFDNGGRARVASADRSALRIELEQGRVVGEVDPGREGPRLVISTKAGDVVVTGTVFSVQVQGDRVDVRVFRGSVRVEEPGRDERSVRLGQAFALGTNRVEGIGDEEQIEVRSLLRAIDLLGGDSAAMLVVDSIPSGASVRVDDVLLGRTPLRARLRAGNRHMDVALDGRQSVRELVRLAADAETHRAYELAEVEPEIAAAAQGTGAKGSADADTAAPVERATPAELLLTAQGFRSGGDSKGAAAAYEDLATRFPASAEGRAALVSAGTINLERLGRPSRALLCFDRYLASVKQGTLAQEAALGRAQAFKAMGDQQREAAAIEAFLMRFPGAIQAARAQRRLEELKSMAP
ncbi:MAG: PEGA domain-containing protein [Deltaproteobacteria bacterium]|nr:PEGA domain-containing protein [Deltaproteobacteria bacterium]